MEPKNIFLLQLFLAKAFSILNKKIFKIVLTEKLSRPIFAIRSKKKSVVLRKNNQVKQGF
jgi:hypothetical protein